MLHSLKKIIPTSWLNVYHRALSWLAATWYGHPANKLIVIGVTGTNGKTTTTYLTAKALEASGFPTGCTSTAIFKISEHEWLNASKMTMLGRFQTQKLLHEMVKVGCRFTVIETSSQGVLQNRHRDINYDVAVFTNLTPEHIEAHGSFEKYKQAKLDLFRHMATSPRKVFNGVTLHKIAVLNQLDPHAKDFALPSIDRLFWYSSNHNSPADITAVDIKSAPDHTKFRVDEQLVTLQLPGLVNVENALAALAVVKVLGLSVSDAARRLAAISSVPGRFEKIDEGQPWTVIVDYAPEPASVARLYETIKALPRQRIIHVLGSCGGGRDVARRPILGELAGKNADIVFITNEDPYDDDPKVIMEQVAEGARRVGKQDGENLFIIENRLAAIFEAMKKAEPGDLVLLTGKGSEQAICVAGGRKLPWDEREAARKAIRARLAVSSE